MPSATAKVAGRALGLPYDRRVIDAGRSLEAGEMEEWRTGFDAASRRTLARRLRYAFIRTYKPVLDDAPYRSFETMAEYRQWCAQNLPAWLGYGPAV